MRSLRTQLILISALVSGAVIVAFGTLSWYFLEKGEREAVDVKLQSVAGRLMRDLHPRANLDAAGRSILETYGKDLREGALLLEVRDDVNEREIFSSVTEGGLLEESLPEGFPPPVPEPRKRPEWAWQEPPQKGRRPPATEVDTLTEIRAPLRDAPDGTSNRSEDFPGPGSGGDGESESGQEGFRPPPDRYQDFITAGMFGQTWRLLVMRERGYFVLVGVNFATVGESLDSVRRVFIIGIPLALVVLVLGGWLVAERALRPIRTITATASQITARDLGERIPENRATDPEIARLVSVLNGMMDRLERSFTHASRFSSDVSHELKTPIAVIQNEIESALRECEPGTGEESRLLVLREETDRLKSITRSLMLLSQADVGELIRKNESVDLSRELEALVDDAEILAQSSGIAIEAKIEPGAVVVGDPVLLRQALLNLINNGIKYNEKSGFVSISLARESGYIRIGIENSGPGIPKEDRSKVFERFFRGDSSRNRKADGFGLGLSLARAVIEGHGGQLELVNACADATRFEVELRESGDERLHRTVDGMSSSS